MNLIYIYGDSKDSNLLDKHKDDVTAGQALKMACERVEGMQLMDHRRLVLWDEQNCELNYDMPLEQGKSYFIHGRKNDGAQMTHTNVVFGSKCICVPYPLQKQYIKQIRDHACNMLKIDLNQYIFDLTKSELRFVHTWKSIMIFCVVVFTFAIIIFKLINIVL